MKTEQFEGGALNLFLTVPSRFLGSLYAAQLHLPEQRHPSLGPSLLDCDSPGVTSWLSFPYQAQWGHTYNPNPHLLLLLCHSAHSRLQELSETSPNPGPYPLGQGPSQQEAQAGCARQSQTGPACLEAPTPE